jgi:tetratricopeptide (TPR) repeat protein
MKDGEHQILATALNPERMERVLERDKQEIEVEKQIESVRTRLNAQEDRRKRSEVIRKISRKYYELANAMVEDAFYSEAVDLYSKSIAIMKKESNRKAVDSYFNRAITLAMLGYPKMALDDLRTISNAKPEKADVYFVKGQIFESLGREKLAEKMYNKSLSIDPSFYRAAHSLENIRLR